MSLFQPKVSIIIPVYNGANYVREAIDSALMQTYKNIEILVINDGSTDGGKTEQIAQSYGDKIRYFSKPNGGVATALNLGVEKMTGEYFSWLSHDDVYFKNKVEAQVKHFATLENKETIVYSDFQLIDEKSKPFADVVIHDFVSNNILYDLLVHQAIHGCAMMIPKSIFDKVGKFDASLPTTQDYDLWVRMAQKFPFSYCPGIIIKSRQHPEQGSRQAIHSTAVVDFFNLHLKKMSSQMMKSSFPAQERMGRYLVFMRRLAALSLYGNFMYIFREALGGADDLGFKQKMKFVLKSGWILFSATIGSRVKKMIPLTVKKILRKSYHLFKRFILKPSKLDFTEIYKRNIFGSSESHSGEGSTMEQTKIIRTEIPQLVKNFDVQSFLDIPCGDFNWMKHVEMGELKYTGADLVEDLVEKCNAQYGNANREFRKLNLIEDKLPQVDLIFCRDCLVHMNYDDAMNAIENMKRSGSKYLLATTFTERAKNENLYGIWRPLNLEKAPFSFPKPVALINEGCTEADRQFMDKSLGLWRLSDL